MESSRLLEKKFLTQNQGGNKASQYMTKQVLSVRSEVFKQELEIVDDVRLSVIVPAYAEASVLRQNLKFIERAASHITHS